MRHMFETYPGASFSVIFAVLFFLFLRSPFAAIGVASPGIGTLLGGGFIGLFYLNSYYRVSRNTAYLSYRERGPLPGPSNYDKYGARMPAALFILLLVWISLYASVAGRREFTNFIVPALLIGMLLYVFIFEWRYPVPGAGGAWSSKENSFIFFRKVVERGILAVLLLCIAAFLVMYLGNVR